MDISPTMIGRVIIAAGAAATWLITGSVTQDAANSRESQSAAARPQQQSAPPAGFAESLHERMRQPAIPEAGRNPFRYGSRRAPSRDEAAVTAAPAAMPPQIIEPPQPLFKLSGIAASQQDGGTVLTAIVIDNGVMVFAKTGDRLSNGYSVVQIDETSITLVDAAGVTQTIRLP
jgi:hypothetical protein